MNLRILPFLLIGLALPSFGAIEVTDYAGLSQAMSTNVQAEVVFKNNVRQEGNLPVLGASKTVKGEGKLLAGNRKSAFEIHEDMTLSVSDLAIYGTRSNERGGSAFYGSGRLELQNVHCYTNTVAMEEGIPMGGSALMDEGSLAAKNSSFHNCYVPFQMGAASRGGAIGAVGGSIKVENCLFTNCYAGMGGAIAANEDASIELCGTNLFIANSCMDYAGAAIYSVNGDIAFAPKACNIFAGNKAIGGEGLIYVADLDSNRSWDLSGCLIVSNQTHSTISINASEGRKMILNGGEFRGNRSGASNSIISMMGDLYWHGLKSYGNVCLAKSVSCGDLSLEWAVFDGNAAEASLISYNGLRQNAAASAFWADGNVALTNSIIRNNVCRLKKEGPGGFYRPYAGSFGTMTIDNYTGRENLVSLKFCRVNGNSAGYGGAFSLIGDSPIRMVMTQTLITNNSAYCGGAIHVYGPDVRIEAGGAAFRDNWAEYVPGSSNIQGLGGAVFMEPSNGEHQTGSRSSLSISDAVMERNDACDGGAIYNWGQSVTLADVNFIGNHAFRTGGAIYNGKISLGGAIYNGVTNDLPPKVTIEAREKDVAFKDNNCGDMVSNAIYNEGALEFAAKSGQKINFNDSQTIYSSSGSTLAIRPIKGQANSGLVTFWNIAGEADFALNCGARAKVTSKLAAKSLKFQEGAQFSCGTYAVQKFIFASTNAELQAEYSFSLGSVFKDSKWQESISLDNLEAVDANGLPYEFELDKENGVMSNFAPIPEPVCTALLLLALLPLSRLYSHCPR